MHTKAFVGYAQIVDSTDYIHYLYTEKATEIVLYELR